MHSTPRYGAVLFSIPALGFLHRGHFGSSIKHPSITLWWGANTGTTHFLGLKSIFGTRLGSWRVRCPGEFSFPIPFSARANFCHVFWLQSILVFFVLCLIQRGLQHGIGSIVCLRFCCARRRDRSRPLAAKTHRKCDLPLISQPAPGRLIRFPTWKVPRAMCGIWLRRPTETGETQRPMTDSPKAGITKILLGRSGLRESLLA